jgi:hypothetical protein
MNDDDVAAVVEQTSVTSVTVRAGVAPAGASKDWYLEDVLWKLGLEDTPQHREWLLFVAQDTPGTTTFVYTVVVYSDQTRIITLAAEYGMESVRLTRAANGVLTKQEYLIGDRPSRFDGPAATYWNTDGKIIFEGYIIDGVFHNTDGPAMTRMFPDTGTMWYERWYRYGRIHNDNDDPAIVYYNEDGSVKKRKWYTDGVMTREETYSRERRRA